MATTGEMDLKVGFLTAIELPNGGHVGGLLVTNRFGRPLEFQCTTPVRPNRTQEILYGSTLRPFLLGEVIARTLIEKASVKPDLVLTENDDLLELRLHISQPVAVVASEDSAETDAADEDLVLGQARLRFHSAHTEDGPKLSSSADHIPEQADLSEPFERVREALRETMKAGSG